MLNQSTNMRRLRHWARGLIAGLLLLPGFAAAQSFTHVHLRVPDTDGAAQWYQSLLGGEFRPGGMASARYENGFIGTMPDDTEPAGSGGSVIDHIGFSVEDVATTLGRAETMGAGVVNELRDGALGYPFAMIEDPWGTRVELVQDAEYPGLHHVHLRPADAQALRDWFLEVFGGDHDPDRGMGRFDAIRYEGIWVYISANDEPPAASRGRSLDHMGFSVDDMDTVIENVRGTGYDYHELRPARPGSTTLLMFFEGADGVHFEIAQPNGVAAE